MPTMRRLQRLGRTLLGRPSVEAEMEEEMRLHLQLETEELIRGGMPPSEARRQAAIGFGGVQQRKEEALDDGRLWRLEGLWRDARIATRTLFRRPAFAITAIMALALAIAVNTTLFSILDAMINPRNGAAHSEQLYEIKYFGDPRKRVDFRQTDTAVAAAAHLFDGITALRGGSGVAVERAGRAHDADVAIVQPNFFALMGVNPIEGRTEPGAGDASAISSIVISERLRAVLYADGEPVLNSVLEVDGAPLTVIGVVRRSTAIGVLDNDAWRFPRAGDWLGRRVIRLRSGTTFEAANQQLAIIAERLALAAEDTPRSTAFNIKPVTRQFHAAKFHYALIGAGIAILLVACTNLANLQIARGLGRSAELALRGALGATRPQLVAQLLLESSVLAALALGVGLVLTVAGNAILRATIPSSIGKYVVEPQSSWRMVAFAAIAAVVCMLTIGLVPALRVSRVDLNSLMKSRAGTGAHRKNQRVYGGLVIAQIALTLPLVCAAVLLSRAAIELGDSNHMMRDWYGYDPAPLVTAIVRVPGDSTVPKLPIGEIASNMIAKLRAIPGVVDAAVTPVQNIQSAAGEVTVDDVDGGLRQVHTPFWSYRVVSSSYFRTFGLPMESGRDFDDGVHVAPSVLVDRGTAEYLWPRSGAVGRRMRFAAAESTAKPFLAVQGVVGSRRSAERERESREIFGARMGAVWRVLTLYDSTPAPKQGARLVLAIRARGDPVDVIKPVRAELRTLTALPANVILHEEYLGISRQRESTRFIAGLFTILALMALGLSALGIYGIVSQSVADRRREVAVRIALGSTPRDIVYALIRQGNVLLLAGLAIGLYLTKQTFEWVALFLNGVSSVSTALFFAGVCVLVFVTIMFAALVPAMRATRLDPMEALRAE